MYRQKDFNLIRAVVFFFCCIRLYCFPVVPLIMYIRLGFNAYPKCLHNARPTRSSTKC